MLRSRAAVVMVAAVVVARHRVLELAPRGEARAPAGAGRRRVTQRARESVHGHRGRRLGGRQREHVTGCGSPVRHDAVGTRHLTGPRQGRRLHLRRHRSVGIQPHAPQRSGLPGARRHPDPSHRRHDRRQSRAGDGAVRPCPRTRGAGSVRRRPDRSPRGRRPGGHHAHRAGAHHVPEGGGFQRPVQGLGQRRSGGDRARAGDRHRRDRRLGRVGALLRHARHVHTLVRGRVQPAVPPRRDVAERCRARG